MKRLATGLLALLFVSSGSRLAGAQDEQAKGAATGEVKVDAEADASAKVEVPAIDDPLNDPMLEEGATETPLPGKQKPGEPAKARAKYDDIVVVPRKDFLKSGRVELAPMTGLSINDSLIRHYAFGGDITYFLTDVFGVGLQGTYMIKERTDREGLVGLQYNRTASLNKYLWSAALNFSYIPVYGKFALFNRNIIHWDVFASAGVGVTQTEIIPRKPSDETFTTLAVTPNFGVGARFYLLDWLSLNFAIRDYIFPDKFEPLNRTTGQPIEQVKDNARGQLVNNLMVFAGVGFYLPPSFDYKMPR